jgi:hypothetical protein
MQQQRASLSPEQQESARRIITATRQQLRANLSPEQQRNARRINAMYFNNDVDVLATIKELEFRHLNEN